jgi:cob(I)alamin adenosyltransferase
MSIVTKTGDQGTTGLFGGKRVSKADARIHAYGTVDELNALFGVLLAEEMPPAIGEGLTRLQHELFILGADLASPLDCTWKVHRMEPRHVTDLETWITQLEASLPALQYFILPGGVRAAVQLHLARTVCRRAERWVVALKNEELINDHALTFLNRLGDLLFLLARAANKDADMQETRVEYH